MHAVASLAWRAWRQSDQGRSSQSQTSICFLSPSSSISTPLIIIMHLTNILLNQKQRAAISSSVVRVWVAWSYSQFGNGNLRRFRLDFISLYKSTSHLLFLISDFHYHIVSLITIPVYILGMGRKVINRLMAVLLLNWKLSKIKDLLELFLIYSYSFLV